MRFVTSQGSIFTKILPLLIRHIGFIYIVQSELSSNFCTNYPVIKKYLVSFFVKTNSCQFQNKKRFCFSNKSLRASSVALINRRFVETHFLLTRGRSPHSIPTNSMVVKSSEICWRWAKISRAHRIMRPSLAKFWKCGEGMTTKIFSRFTNNLSVNQSFKVC